MPALDPKQASLGSRKLGGTDVPRVALSLARITVKKRRLAVQTAASLSISKL